MLTQKEILNEIFILPVSEQREIAEKINQNTERISESEENNLSVKERVAIAMQLSGCLKPEAGFTPMTREEEREIIEEYLAEKYS